MNENNATVETQRASQYIHSISKEGKQRNDEFDREEKRGVS